jgi:hypothetical protein
MRGVGLVGLCAALGSCTPAAKFEANCNRVFREFCDHQVACDIHFDSLACQEEEAAESYCNPETTEAKYKQCFSEFGSLQCEISAGEDCLDILCDNDLGCREEGEHCCETPTTGGDVQLLCPGEPGYVPC